MLTRGSSKACASCKYQRRKCNKECLLAPYFPADQPQLFQNAHRLFGVSNMQKLLKMVEPSRRDEAMKTIIYQANMRAQDPVCGCTANIHRNRYLIRLLTQELHDVRMQIAICKEQVQQQNHASSYGQPRSSVCESSSLPAEADCGAFANLMDSDYDFDMVQAKHNDNNQRVAHGEVNFQPEIDDIYGGNYVPDGQHQGYMEALKSSMSSSCLNLTSRTEVTVGQSSNQQYSPIELQNMAATTTAADFGGGLKSGHVKNEFGSHLQALIFNRANTTFFSR